MIFCHSFYYFSPPNTNSLEDKFYHIDDDLLVKHLLGEAIPQEQEAVRQWIAADLSHQQYYNQLKQVWETSRQLAAVTTADENEAWNRFRQRIQKPAEPVIEAPVRRIWRPALKIAASIVLLVGIGLAALWMFNRPDTVEQMLVKTDRDTQVDVLPDGSVVTLNKQSTLQYPSRFDGKQRTVRLEGEAFFQVAADKNKPFVIAVNDISIRVVGTAFNVKGLNGETEVVVESGRVQVTKKGKTVELVAGEKVNTAPGDKGLLKEAVSDNLYNYYRTREFVCDDTPLWKLVDVLNEAYGANIVIGNEAMRDMRLNATFYNESLDQVLEVISLTFSIRVTKTSNQIILQ